MFHFKRAAIRFLSCAVAFSFSACEKEALSDRDIMAANSKSIGQREDGVLTIEMMNMMIGNHTRQEIFFCLEFTTAQRTRNTE
jgi:hypothetical protein